ncbi:AAA family ATPase [Aestuariivirga sp.]|uniref:AAA family ATPase n=1 Tax=Aestuariivirga sp. TaxID=2650926 RepID=UPI0039E363C7
MKAFEARHYLLKAEVMWERVKDRSVYPYALPAVAKSHELVFSPTVTFLVGENGSGKSTLIEALAIAWGFNAEGGSKNFNFGTHEFSFASSQRVEADERHQTREGWIFPARRKLFQSRNEYRDARRRTGALATHYRELWRHVPPQTVAWRIFFCPSRKQAEGERALHL